MHHEHAVHGALVAPYKWTVIIIMIIIIIIIIIITIISIVIIIMSSRFHSPSAIYSLFCL